MTSPTALPAKDQKSTQHTGMSIDQLQKEDSDVELEKLGDNKAAAVPLSGGKQHKPHKRNCQK